MYKTPRRLALLLCCAMLTVSGCATDKGYERTVGGMAIGAAAGSTAAFEDPKNLGPGILIGAIVGGLIGYMVDIAHAGD